jgi:ATP-binding cassette subfamily B protein
VAEIVKQSEARPSARQVWVAVRRMLCYGREASPRALPLLFVLVAVISLLPFLSSYIDSKVVDEIVRLLGLSPADRVLNRLITLIIVVVVASVVEKSLWAVIMYADRVNYFNISRVMTLKFLKKASELDMYHYENTSSNDVIQKAKDIYTWKPPAFLSRSVWMTGDFIRLVSSIAIILTFSVPAFILVVCTTLPSLIVNLRLGKGMWGIWDTNATDKRRFWHSANMLVNENSLMELRIFQSRSYLLQTVTRIYDQFTDKERSAQLRRTTLESLVGNLSTLGTMAFWVIAIFATLRGDITLGLLTFYTTSLRGFSDSLNNLFRNLSAHYEDGLYLNNLFRFLDLENAIQPGKMKLAVKNQPPRIEFRNVSFTYPGIDRQILKNFNLTIEPGEHVALVGTNGAGKTTIIKLLSRFYDVTQGQILIDGIDIRDLDPETWYRQLGVLFQGFIRYNQFDVRTNIELGDMTHHLENPRLEEAIYKADAGTFIDTYESKLEQVLDRSYEGGVQPSDGQWQRLALARAFFRDAPVLVLDEPTSAIDARAEYQIFERLYEFSQDKTLLIISHRFSTVRNADRICVINNGQITETGTHEELMRVGGRYRDAFETQAQGYR